MRVGLRLAVVACALLLTAACTGQVRDDEPSRPSASGASPYATKESAQRSQLLDIPRGAPPKSGWFRGATIWPPGAVDPIRLQLQSRGQVGQVVPYRGGYLAAIYSRGKPGSAAVFTAQGQFVRRLDGCLQSLVRSADRDLVAWLMRDCGGSGDRTLWVGPTKDRRAPDQSMVLPVFGGHPGYENGYPSYAAAVGRWGAIIEVTDGLRGYSKGVYVVRPQTGEVRRVPDAYEVAAVSARGIACCVDGAHSLIDLDTLQPVGPAEAIVAWSPDGTEGLVQRQRSSRVDVVDTRSGKVLRSLTLPAAVSVRSGQWEDADNLTFDLYRYSSGSDQLFSTIVRVTLAGDVERVAGVTQGDPHVL